MDLGTSGGIRANLIAWLAGEGFSCPEDARVQLVTFPRVLGYGFNPVSFYYLFARSGRPLAAATTERGATMAPLSFSTLRHGREGGQKLFTTCSEKASAR